MDTALVYSEGVFGTEYGKTANGLARFSNRYKIVGIVDSNYSGMDAGHVLDRTANNIRIFKSIEHAINSLPQKPDYLIYGLISFGGKITHDIITVYMTALSNGLSIISGLHDFASDIPALVEISKREGLEIIDVRKTSPKNNLHYWTGKILKNKIPIIPVLGTDCAIGKRTTACKLAACCKLHGINAEIIYTGQTGRMQGLGYGFVLDATVNDFISGELEYNILTCIQEKSPDIILIEGQSGLFHPSGPGGAVLIVSANADAVILQHKPSRKYFYGMGELNLPIPSLEKSIQLINLYGAPVLAITLNFEGLPKDSYPEYKERLEKKLKLPVMDPLLEDMDSIIPIIDKLIKGKQNNPEKI